MATKIPTKKWPEGWQTGCDPYTEIGWESGYTQEDGEEG